MITIEKLHLPFILSSLGRASFGGVLSLLEGEVERRLLFNSGRVVNVLSSLQEETLGHMLLTSGKLSSQQYSTMLGQMAEKRQPAGAVLIAMNILNPQDILAALEFQARKKTLNCFKMVDFGFELHPGKIAPEHQITNMEYAELILTGIQYSYTTDRVMIEFPINKKDTFKVRSGSEKHPVALDSKQTRIYNSLRKPMKLNDLTGTGDDLQETIATLYGLFALELIDSSEINRPDTSDLGLEPSKPLPQPQIENRPTAIDSQAKQALATTPKTKPATLKTVMAASDVDPKLAEKILALARDNHFDILEIGKSSSIEETSEAYNRLVLEYGLGDIKTTYSTEKERLLAGRLLDQATLAFRELSDYKARALYVKELRTKGDITNSREIPPLLQAGVEAQKGELALTAKYYKEAKELFAAAVELYPREPSFLFKLGLAGFLEATSDLPKKATLPESICNPFLQVLKIDPRYDMAHLYIGYFYKRNKMPKKALREFEKALAINPRNNLADSELHLLKRKTAK